MEAKQVRWHEEDYLLVLRAGMHKKHQGPLAMLKAGQSALPRDKRMTPEALELRVKAKSSAKWEAMYVRAAAIPEAAALPAKEGSAPPIEASGRKAKAYWTKLEWARCARLVEQMRIAEPGVKLHKLYSRAQLIVIDTDRQKTPSAFIQAEHKGNLAIMHKQGLADAWLLPPEDKPAPAAEAEAKEPTKTPQEAANNAAMAQHLAEAVGEAPAPVAPPAPSLPPTLAALTIETPGLESALALFGQQLAQSVGLLIQASQRETRAAIDSKLAAASQRIGQQVADTVQSMVGSIVTKTLTDVLNAPIPASAPAPAMPPAASPAPAADAASKVASKATPAPSAAPSAPAAAPAPAEPPKLRVDVLGLPTLADTVAVSKGVGSIAELRFFDIAARGVEYAPHRGRHVILAQGVKLPRKLSDKFQATRVQPLLVKASPFNVMHAIEELARSKGIHV